MLFDSALQLLVAGKFVIFNALILLSNDIQVSMHNVAVMLCELYSNMQTASNAGAAIFSNFFILVGLKQVFI